MCRVVLAVVFLFGASLAIGFPMVEEAAMSEEPSGMPVGLETEEPDINTNDDVGEQQTIQPDILKDQIMMGLQLSQQSEAEPQQGEIQNDQMQTSVPSEQQEQTAPIASQPETSDMVESEQQAAPDVPQQVEQPSEQQVDLADVMQENQPSPVGSPEQPQETPGCQLELASDCPEKDVETSQETPNVQEAPEATNQGNQSVANHTMEVMLTSDDNKKTDSFRSVNV